jgi:hypothetical protein
MSTTDPPGTYRYVADGRFPRRLTRERWARVLDPRVLAAFLAVSLLLGVGLSLVANAHSLPHHLARVVLIGVVWGLGWLLVVALLSAALLVPLAMVREQQIAAQYPAGSVTEITLGAEDLVVVRPSGEHRMMPYAAIRLVRTYGSTLAVRGRGRFWPLVLPTGALPPQAVDHLAARAGIAPSVTVIEPTGGQMRQFTVPEGWSEHMARVYVASTLKRRTFALRFGSTALVLLVLGVLVSWWWALVVPVLLAVVLVGAYVPTRRRLAAALPPGSEATTEVFEDRLVSRNAGGGREIRYADVEAVTVRRDVAMLRLTSGSVLLLARSLVPDEVLARVSTP